MSPTVLPDANMGDDTAFSFTSAVTAPQESTAPWWEAFDDPLLRELIVTGLRSNATVHAADQRILSAKANAERVGVRIDPTVQATASVARPASAENVAGAGSLSITLDLDTSRQQRRDQDRAMIAIAEAIAARDQLVLDLTGTIATNFVRLAADEERIRQANEDIRRGQTLVRALEGQIEAGDATQFELLRARANLLDARATLRRLEGEKAARAQELAALAGGERRLVARLAAGRGPLGLRVHNLPSAVPADAVRARPGIRQIELQYDAARVRVRDAEAERLPRLFLTGTIDATSPGLGWRFGPSISLPPLSARARNAAVERDVAAAQALLFEWQAAVISGVSEVEAAQARLAGARSQLEHLRRARAEYDEALRIADTLYEEGEIALPERLDLEQSRSTSTGAMIDARVAHLIAFIDLNVALGRLPPG